MAERADKRTAAWMLKSKHCCCGGMVLPQRFT
jgi:hypothetical protein